MASTRLSLLLVAGIAPFAASCLQSCSTSTSQKQKTPNVIFILADDLGWAETACYGNKFNETPNIDRLAEEGIRFTQAYAAAPVCSPYRASLMSGQYPARLGITDYLRPDDTRHLPVDLTTLADLFYDRGYATGIIGKWHLSGYAKRGVQEYPPSLHGFTETIACENDGIAEGSYFYPYHFNTELEQRIEGKEYLVDRLNMEAVDFIERHSEEPFFLYLSHYAVHTKVVGREDYLEYFRNKPGAGTHPQNDEWAPDNNPHLAAQLKVIDDGIGMILDKLKELGLDQSTLIIFTSDNGGETRVTSNAPLRGGKSMLYEGGIREPLIIRYPGHFPKGIVCEQPTASYDFLPTICELLDTALPDEQVCDGLSILPVLSDPDVILPDRRFYWHYPLNEPHFLGGRSASAIRDGKWKLIMFHDTGETELYNLESDPGEETNLAMEEKELCKDLQIALSGWIMATVAAN